MNTMRICMYGKEAKLFEKMLKNQVGLTVYTFTKKWISNSETGLIFTIEAENGIEFYFIGREWTRRMMRYHCKHYAFNIIED